MRPANRCQITPVYLAERLKPTGRGEPRLSLSHSPLPPAANVRLDEDRKIGATEKFTDRDDSFFIFLSSIFL